MEIDLGPLHRGDVSSISLNGEYELPKEFYENTDIIRLSPLTVDGEIIQKENDDLELEDYCICKIQGKMILLKYLIFVKTIIRYLNVSHSSLLPQATLK